MLIRAVRPMIERLIFWERRWRGVALIGALIGLVATPLDVSALDRIITFNYDETTGTYPKGRLTSLTDTEGPTVTYNYDQRGNTSSVKKTIDSVDYLVRYTYDSLNRVVDLTYPDGEVIRHSYNGQGLLEKVASATYGTDYVANFNYNALDQKTRRDFPNGNTIYDYYDSTAKGPLSFRLRNIKTTITTQIDPLQDLTFAYDYLGNVTSIADNAGPNDQTFGYDSLGRLTSAASGEAPPFNEAYNYDAIGNMTAYAGKVLTYPLAGLIHPHAVLSDGESNYEYDANGNLKTKTTGTTVHRLTWDFENHLTQVEANGTGLAQFAYDFAGERVKKTAGGITTVYLGKLYKCVPGTCTKYIFAGGDRVASRPVGSNAVHYFHHDHLGSTHALTDSTGGIIQKIAYFPYGGKRTNSLDPASGESHKFTGQELDDETGLYHYGARYYDPSIGRFISPDTIAVRPETPQKLNRYSYVLNNPVRHIDTSGNEEKDITNPSLPAPILVAGGRSYIDMGAGGGVGYYTRVESVKMPTSSGQMTITIRTNFPEGTKFSVILQTIDVDSHPSTTQNSPYGNNPRWVEVSMYEAEVGKNGIAELTGDISGIYKGEPLSPSKYLAITTPYQLGHAQLDSILTFGYINPCLKEDCKTHGGPTFPDRLAFPAPPLAPPVSYPSSPPPPPLANPAQGSGTEPIVMPPITIIGDPNGPIEE